MTDARTGPPPENETAALVGKPGQRRDFDNSSSADNATTGVALSPKIELHERCQHVDIPSVYIAQPAHLKVRAGAGGARA